MISLCLIYKPTHPTYPPTHSCLSSTILILLFSNSGKNCDQSSVECETVSLDDSKKFRIININQAAAELDGPGNKFEHKAQLIEIDKLLINTQNGSKQTSSSSRVGVWHQVSCWFISYCLFSTSSSPARFSSK